MNRATLIGRIGSDYKVVTTENGVTIGKLSLATSEKYKDKSGEIKEETTWHNVVVFGNYAEHLKAHLEKGQAVFVEGKITNRKFTDRDGNDKQVHEITATQIYAMK